MYKDIKRIISLSIIIISLTTIVPSKGYNLEIKAYAAESKYQDAKDCELTSLEVNSTDGKTFDLCDDYDGNKIELTDTKSYYVRVNTADNKLIVSAKVKGTNYVVKLFESDRANATGHDTGDGIDITKGKSTLYLRTFTSEEAYKRAQDKEDVTGSEKLYKIYIKNTDSIGQDNIYLDKITIDGGNIPLAFDYQKFVYDVSVKENEDTVEIKSTPEKADYSVKINNNKANEENKYTRKITLNPGKNQVEIRVQDYDNIKERIYTLNIYRGISIPVSNTNSSTLKSESSTGKIINTNNSSLTIKANQWVQVNDSWKYNDATGNPLKNTWFYDRTNGKYYYLQADGALAIGWLNNDGQWYYLNAFGVRQTGWQNINGKWYYLNSDGIMQVGWIKDTTGKFYYLNSDGSMVYNATINGYKLGADGAWIK